MAAEIDAKDDDGNLVEIKCCVRTGDNPYRQKTYYDVKQRRWWIQSALVNVTKIALAWRTDEGDVDKIECVKTDDIPGIANENGGTWKPTSILNFLEEYLTKVGELTSSRPGKVCRFTFHPCSRVVTWKLVKDDETTLSERITAVQGGTPAEHFCKNPNASGGAEVSVSPSPQPSASAEPSV